jgi:hypothetical protein
MLYMPTPSPKKDRAKPEVDDRRRSNREQVVTVGTIRPLTHDDASAEQVLVVDVSLHGVGFRSTRSLTLGTRFHIEIGVGPLHLTSRLKVIRNSERSDGTFDVGGEFC